MNLTQLVTVDLNLLLAFEAMFTARSVSGMAEVLGITQSAGSRTLGRLRVLFEDPLFIRTAQEWTPTPRAEALRPQLEALLERAAGMVASPDNFDPASSRRTFTVATDDYGEATMLPLLLEALSRQAPGVKVRVVPDGSQWEEALRTGAWDLRWTPREQGSAAVVWTTLFEEDSAVVLRRGHRAAKGRFTLARFTAQKQVAIAPRGQPGNRLDQALARLKLTREVTAQVRSFLVAAQLVAQTDLIATLPLRIIAAQAKPFRLEVRALPFKLAPFTFAQAWHERFRHDRGHAWFRQLAVHVVRAPTFKFQPHGSK